MLTRRAFLGGAAAGLAVGAVGALTRPAYALNRTGVVTFRNTVTTPEVQESLTWEHFNLWCDACEQLFELRFLERLGRYRRPTFVAEYGDVSRGYWIAQFVTGSTFGRLQQKVDLMADNMAARVGRRINSLPMGTLGGYVCRSLPGLTFETPPTSQRRLSPNEITVYADLVGEPMTYRDLVAGSAAGKVASNLRWIGEPGLARLSSSLLGLGV